MPIGYVLMVEFVNATCPERIDDLNKKNNDRHRDKIRCCWSKPAVNWISGKEMYHEMQQIVRDEGVFVIPMIANMVDAASKKAAPDKPAGNQEVDGLRICERWWFA